MMTHLQLPLKLLEVGRNHKILKSMVWQAYFNKYAHQQKEAIWHLIHNK